MALVSPFAPQSFSHQSIERSTGAERLSTSLYVDWIEGKGRGVIAGQFFAQGTVIERAPAIEFPASERTTIDRTALFSHYFVDPAQYGKGQNVDGFIALGLSSLCNHAEQPGARVIWRRDPLGLWAELTALCDLDAGQEVTVYYTNIEDYPDRSQFLA